MRSSAILSNLYFGLARDGRKLLKSLRALWKEPRAPEALGPQWYDWVLVGVIVGVTGIEGFFREELAWRTLTTVSTMALMLTLPWRRTRPLQVVILAFGASTVTQLSALLLEVEWTGLFTNIFILLLPYSLLRWASGREAFAGLGFVFISFATTIGIGDPPLSEILGGNLVLLFPAALGASARYRDAAEKRMSEQVRLREREQLARELHDTVAHHISAIAIQAQAGKALAANHPRAPVEALEIIEDAASKTLSEMRRIVRAMREDGQPEFAPVASIADIERLVLDQSYPLAIDLSLVGDLDGLGATLTSTLYRLTQESITNAVRHAHGAENLTVRIVGEAMQVRLTIQDDGNFVVKQGASGLGIRGMAERATLLGGSLTAGPGQQYGWVVEATLPRGEATL